MILGVRVHDFGRRTCEEHAKIISEKGFKAVQLALSKAIAGLDASPGKLNPGMAYYVSDAFSRHGIRIAVLGCYINPVHPVESERKRQLDRFKEHIRYARDFGCSIVATETGSMNADFSYHPDNHGEKAFGILCDSILELAEEAEKYGVLVAVEGVSHYVANSPERIKRLIDTVDSNNLQVILDPVNLLSPSDFKDQEIISEKAFDLFGDRIVALHAKDFVLEDGCIRSVQAGKGLLNYEMVFRLLKERKPMCYVLMEDTQPEQIDEGIYFLKTVYDRA